MNSELSPLELEPYLRRAAGSCTREHPHLFEDFLQEMWVAVLEAPPGQTRSWYVGRAAWLAQHWMRAELLRTVRNVPVEVLDA